MSRDLFSGIFGVLAFYFLVFISQLRFRFCNENNIEKAYFSSLTNIFIVVVKNVKRKEKKPSKSRHVQRTGVKYHTRGVNGGGAMCGSPPWNFRGDLLSQL